MGLYAHVNLISAKHRIGLVGSVEQEIDFAWPKVDYGHTYMYTRKSSGIQDVHAVNVHIYVL